MPVCNFLSSPSADAIVGHRVAAAQARLAGLCAEDGLTELADSRALHAMLFTGLAPPAFPDAAGTWRGTPGSSIAAAPRAVFLARRLPGLRARDLCLPPDEVPAAMAALGHNLREIWQDRPGQADPWRDAGFKALATVTARFFAIHPYMDGNGHVWRLSLPLLARRLGIETRDSWTPHRRPYGPEFSLALQWHRDHPSLLADQLRRWFRPSGPAGAEAGTGRPP